MAVQRLNIRDFLSSCQNHLLIDVRSPGEYSHAHMPAAKSLPLFTDAERKEVGTAYKQKSREVAIKIGLDFFGPKMRSMVEQVEEWLHANASSSGNHEREIFVYCWRGGMRSSAVAWLLDLYGFNVYTLAGGYKSYRNHVLQTFEQPFSFRIVGGYTGSGKTEVLHELDGRGEAVIDLEGVACHKGSAFGSFKMPPQPTQEMFENQLAELLWQKATHDTTVWLEDESQRIGNLNIPGPMWNNMRTSPVVFLEIPFEARLDHILEEYGDCDREKLIEAVQRISQRLGGLETKNTIGFLEDGQVRSAFAILLKYYDKRYLKGLHNREQLSALLTTINCPQVSASNALRLTKAHPV